MRLGQGLPLLFCRILRVVQGRCECDKGLPQRHDGGHVVPDLPLGLKSDDRKSAWHPNRIADRANRHLGDDSGDRGIKLVGLHPA